MSKIGLRLKINKITRILHTNDQYIVEGYWSDEDSDENRYKDMSMTLIIEPEFIHQFDQLRQMRNDAVMVINK